MFIPHKWHKESEPWETVPAPNGTTYKVGQALSIEGGNLVKATGTVKPTHICMEDVTTTKDGQKIHVERVREETVYETELSVESAAIAVGEKYTIDANGEKITATADGVAEVVSYDGIAAGAKVRVRFS
jgi:hypothetical protein